MESRSIVIGASPGPVPAAQARASATAVTLSSWRTWPKVNDRRNVPSEDGAMGR
ncbi:MAG: hypothetical protein M3Q23_00030 [Actinomycetota bacterium]|nr:hypothetical protein [Actinomycetota bacterium]